MTWISPRESSLFALCLATVAGLSALAGNLAAEVDIGAVPVNPGDDLSVRVFPVVGLHAGYPIGPAVSAGLILGAAGWDMTGPCAEVEAGATGGELLFGFASVSERWDEDNLQASRVLPLEGFAIKGALVRTWGRSDQLFNVDPNQTYAGLEVSGLWLLNLTVGGLAKIDGNNHNNFILDASIGIGF